jgi:curli biogenesis system outer membrane secretion channel CsgG
MKKFVMYALMLAYFTITVWPTQAQEQFGKPKVAVYMAGHSGYSNDEGSTLKISTINALIKSGQYRVIERSNVIETELQKQASGAVDDNQLTAFGRQAGVQYICIVGNDGPARMRMIDVETTEILGWGRTVKEMLRTVQPPNATNMPKVAVYVTGERKEALYDYTLNALLTKSRSLGTFKVVERSEAFTKQIDKEQITQRSGHIDDNQIAQLGRQYGVERILVASMVRTGNAYSIFARIINIETALVENAGTIDDMVEEIMGLAKGEKSAKSKRAAGGAWELLCVLGMMALCIWAVIALIQMD